MTDIKFLMEALKSRASHCVDKLIDFDMKPCSHKCGNGVFQYYEDRLGINHFSNYAFQAMIDAYCKLESMKPAPWSLDYRKFTTFELTQMIKASYTNPDALSELVDALNQMNWNTKQEHILAKLPKIDYAQAFLNKDVTIDYFFN